MKVLHVIHGYPPFYMSGSEVYTFNLTKVLSKYIDVSVFTRIENPYTQPYHIYDEKINNINIYRVNKPLRDYTLRDKYLDQKIDDIFYEYVKMVQPDVVHIGHLSHLSTNIINIAKEKYGLPVIYTIHDFWMFCFRGQFIDPSLNLCSGVTDENCLNCAKYLFKEWVSNEDIDKYRKHMERVINNIDIFLSPSQFLGKFYIDNGVNKNKIINSKYGFDKDNIKYKKRIFQANSSINFGFIGRIVPVKGVRLLLEAFSELQNEKSKLFIFGDDEGNKKYLDQYGKKNIVYMGGFDNRKINNVLDRIDVLIVPSIWYENSPLVIQEAFLAGIPVITSNIGGMSELVENGINGFTFEMGNKNSLKEYMEQIVTNPCILNNLIISRNDVRSIKDDAKKILEIYEGVLQ